MAQIDERARMLDLTWITDSDAWQRVTHIPTQHIVLVAFAAFLIWQLVFDDKISAEWRSRVLDRHPPDGHTYAGHDGVLRVPSALNRETGQWVRRVVQYDPAGGQLVQAKSVDNVLLWYAARDLEGRIPEVMAADGRMLLQTTTEPPLRAEPVLTESGQWIIVPGHGSKLGGYLTCPVCPRFGILLVTLTVYAWAPSIVVIVGAAGLARGIGDAFGVWRKK
jgi:hypothetical protein